ncbi:hypothetical protein HAP32_05165 (plasmid) [Serratia fonticola]|nr:hypothetical protein HAP32_05165 [Serratia fonticola]
MQRGMVNDNPARRYHLFEVSQTQCIGEVPADTLSHNIDGIMQATESVSNERHGQVMTSKNNILSNNALMRQNLSRKNIKKKQHVT